MSEAAEKQERRYREPCKSCGGKGFHNWAGDEMCQQCNGTGEEFEGPPDPGAAKTGEK